MNDYEKFKLQWLIDHDITLKDVFVAATIYGMEAATESVKEDIEAAFDEWESEEKIYPNYEEWDEEWDDYDETQVPKCMDCRFFMIKNKDDSICGNPKSSEYGRCVDGRDQNDCFAPVECELSVSQLPKCEKCENKCPDYLVYEALTGYCSGKIEPTENSEYSFKCCTMDTEYITDTICQRCEKNGCHICSAARDAEKLLTGECDAAELVFEVDNTLDEYLKRL